MSIIVDGYNYIGRSKELQLNDPEARDKLIYLMGQYGRVAQKALTIVYDGNYFIDHANRKRQYGRVTVIYTSPMYSADDQIKKMVSHAEPKHRKTLRIITSDAEIVQFVQSHGAVATRVEEFEAQVQEALSAVPDVERAQIRLTDEEVHHWLKEFEEKPTAHDHAKKKKAVPTPAELSDRRKHASPFAGQKPEPVIPAALSESHKSNQAVPLKGRQTQRDRRQREEEREEQERSEVQLSPDEVQAWLQVFRAKRKK